MQSVGIQNGTDIKFYIGGTAITGITENSMSLAVNMRDASTKDSGGKEEVLPGQSSGSISVGFYVAEDAAYPYNNLFDEYVNKSLLAWKYSNENADDTRYKGNAYLESLDRDDPLEDNASASATFHITAGASKETIT